MNAKVTFSFVKDSNMEESKVLQSVRWFDNGYVGKQPVAWKENCVEYWLKELEESMDRCTSCCDITEILLKMVLNTMQPSNQDCHFRGLYNRSD